MTPPRRTSTRSSATTCRRGSACAMDWSGCPSWPTPDGSTARPRCSTASASGDRAASSTAEATWTYAELRVARQPHRARARRGPRAGAGQPRAAARRATHPSWSRAGSRCSRPAASRWRRCRCCARRAREVMIDQGAGHARADRRARWRSRQAAQRAEPRLRESDASTPGRRADVAPFEAGDVRQRRHRRRGRRDHRVHLRHHRPAEGQRPPPPRPAGVVRHLRALRAAPATRTTSSSARRRSRSPSALGGPSCSRCASARRPR